MPKRRLSKQQTRRIRRLQEQRAARSGRGEAPADAELQLGPEQAGLVLSHFGPGVEVEPLQDQGPPCFCHLRANLQGLVAGDRVIWQRGEPSGVVVARQARSSELQRPDRRGRIRTVAANIDRLMLIVAPAPQPHANLIDRYLVAAEDIGVAVTIVLNKVDLLEQCDSQSVLELATVYQSLGYTLLQASTRARAGLDALRRALVGQTTVFVGQSGVGKSSLINALLPYEKLRTADLSSGADKGRHTTTTARLYHLPDGGDLIDSPGIREFALLHLEPATVAAGFVEFRPWLGHCQFRDCRHIDEPGCAITDALARGDILQQRHDSYCRILADNDRA